MYTEESLLKRKALYKHPQIRSAIHSFWNALNLTKDARNRISKRDFLIMNIKIQKALVPDVKFSVRLLGLLL